MQIYHSYALLFCLRIYRVASQLLPGIAEVHPSGGDNKLAKLLWYALSKIIVRKKVKGKPRRRSSFRCRLGHREFSEWGRYWMSMATVSKISWNVSLTTYILFRNNFSLIVASI